jgi:DNA-binding response OmpR family regulator
MTLPAVSKAPILLLCSDSDVLAALQDMLEGAGYVVLPCKDLGSAMDWLSGIEAQFAHRSSLP